MHSRFAIPLLALTILVLGSAAAAAMPVASGSKCSSDWVNNSGAMQCFIQGEDESHAGATHPHYVACTAAGEVFCCVDDDHGNQNCEAQQARATTESDRVKAILAAQATHLKALGHTSAKPTDPKLDTTGKAAP